MTVKELKQAIADLPDHMDVFMEEMETGFQFGLVNSAVVQEINFKEDPYGEILSREKVLVLKEV
ncbi:hypothetical protein MUK51_10810 [Sphingobacterium faecium]|uniref:hypothetical protein n=1 Tax=Sphingobacterium faecium TaxID=34087 RepID=UPI0021B58D4B|nr:hypothetical protein [Sphingobacterium faecium]UXD67721.1 hypothetical protein MUK51_10810 [Sphingobacterium faecium]